MLRPENIAVAQQRRVERILYRLAYTAFALTISRRDDGCASSPQRSVDIVEVEIDVAVAGDYLRDGPCGGRQSIVSLVKCVDEVKVGIYLGDTLIVDNQQRIHVFGHLVRTVKSLENLLPALKQERYGHDAYRQQPFLLGDTRHHRTGTGTGTTAHTGGDKHHLGVVVKYLRNLFGIVLSILAAFLRVIASTEAVTYLHLRRHRGVFKSLGIGVAYHESDIADTLVVHMVDGIVAATAHSYHLDDGRKSLGACRLDEIDIFCNIL